MALEFRIRSDEVDRADPYLIPDLVWDRGAHNADMAMTGDGLDLQSEKGIASAIIICLFTDRRWPDDRPLPYGHTERMGWPGDSFDVREDLFEGELGSYLWTLFPGVLREQERIAAEEYCHEALQPLITQGAMDRFEITASINGTRDDQLQIEILAYSRSAENPIDLKFDVLWRQTEV